MLVIYGATGFTGRRLAEEAAATGIETVLAGRDEARLALISRPLGFPWSTVDLADEAGLDRVARGAVLVVNAAGPFRETAEPLLRACLRSGSHYIDVSGELPTFATAWGYDRVARDKGVMVLPGAAFGIVATDCLGAEAARQLAEARSLSIGLTLPSSFSRGSIKTMMSMMSREVAIRRAGRMTTAPVGKLRRQFDYGNGPRVSLAVNWPDSFTSFITTGIENTTVYAAMDPATELTYRYGAFATVFSGTLIETVAKAASKYLPKEPDREGARSQSVVAEVEDAWQKRLTLRLRTTDAYDFTINACLEVVRRVLNGEVSPGFQTPANAFGANLLRSVPGTSWEVV